LVKDHAVGTRRNRRSQFRFNLRVHVDTIGEADDLLKAARNLNADEDEKHKS